MNVRAQKNQRIIRGLFLFLILGAIAAAAVMFLNGRSEYTFCIQDPKGSISGADVTFRDAGIVEYLGSGYSDGYYELHFQAIGKGATEALVTFCRGDTAKSATIPFTVNAIGMLVRSSILDFNRWNVLWVGYLVSMALASVFLYQEYLYRIRTNLYSYATARSGGIAVFVTALTLLNLALGLYILPDYRRYHADMIWLYIDNAFNFFTMGTIPFIVLFGSALSVSNLVLIRREGFRGVNLLGIAVSAALLAGVAVCIITPKWVTGLPVYNVLSRAQYVLSAMFCFFLSFLLSTMNCGLISAKRVPKGCRDYIIILGCGIRKDGTLKPLLQGRVDRAIWFWNKQLAETGKQAVFIPSGGKGTDEIISEAEAMERYLLTRDIPRECIHPETQSATTLQNMLNSRDIIAGEMNNASVLFSTTNYHVFRSGILARQAGLPADGIGSKTRWYFWPNAFAREFIGLLRSAWRTELAFFAWMGVSLTLLRIFV